MVNFTPLREFLIDEKIKRLSYSQILLDLQQKWGLKYNENHLCTIYSKEIPEKIAETARKHRLLIETKKEDMKKCYTCGRLFPRDNLFFSRNRSRKDGFSSNCKECERNYRIKKGG